MKEHSTKNLLHIIILPIALLVVGSSLVLIYPIKVNSPNMGLIIITLSIVLLIYNVLLEIINQFAKSAMMSNSKIAVLLFPLIKTTLRIFFILITVNIIVSSMVLPKFYVNIANKLINGVLIGLTGWVLSQLLRMGEIWSQQKLENSELDSNYLRSQFTKVKLIKQVLGYLIFILTIAAMLMLFDYVRTIGISLIASAGLLSAILGFAAQKPLSSIFTGIQLAFSQPVKIDDIVIIETEYGTIEEITMTYAVVKLWDSRRMVVPLNYFFDKPIQNWSYRKANLLGTIFFYVDYSAPVEIFREEVEKIVKASPLWDGRLWNLQVTNLTGECMELRVTISASEPSSLWAIRVHIREKLISFINNEYPSCFPRKRVILHEINH